jgi:hypothetical protein
MHKLFIFFELAYLLLDMWLLVTESVLAKCSPFCEKQSVTDAYR